MHILLYFCTCSFAHWIYFFSARLNINTILIFFHGKNNCLRNFFFIQIYSIFEANQLSFLKIWDILNLPFFLFIGMASLNRNQRIACPECGREYTRLHTSRHRKHCGVLKCSNFNFYTYSSEELTDHIKKKHCQHNVNLCAQQSENTLQEKVKLIYF